MKKIILIILSLIFIISMTVTSLATPPPVKTELADATIRAWDSELLILSVGGNKHLGDDVPYLQRTLIESGDIQAAMNVKYPGINSQDLVVIGAYEVEFYHQGLILCSDITMGIEPAIEGVISTSKFGLFYYSDESWHYVENADMYVESGSVKARFSDFHNPSPMLLVVDESTLYKPPVPVVTVGDLIAKDVDGKKVLGKMVHGSIEEVLLYYGMPVSIPTGFPSIEINGEDPEITNDDLVLLRAMDVEVFEDQQFTWPITFSFYFPNVNPNSKVFVLHYDGRWCLLETQVGDGIVNAKSNGNSPIFVYAKSDTLTKDKDPDPVVTKTADVAKEAEITKNSAPVMGDGMINYAVLIMMMAAAGMVIVLRKE